jgi:DNA-binding CsgD family transcriptional regulator
MSSPLELERELAGVVSLSDMAGEVLDRLQRLVGASASTLFSFDNRGGVRTQGGRLEGPMRDYTPDLVEEDVFLSWSRNLPPSTLISDGTGLDLVPHVKSRPYVDFYRPRDIGFVYGVWPTGRRFGSDQMFGLFLSTPSVSRRLSPRDLDKLSQLESPLRSAARRIARFSALEQKCSVLVHLLEQQRGSHVLWDVEGRLVWVSATAQRLLHGGMPGSDLEHAAAVAFRQLRRLDTSSRQTLLGRPQRLRSAGGAPLLVEFSWLPGADRRPWLLAEVRDCSGAQAVGTLTRAEVGILRLLVRGLSDRELGQTLSVSTTTVKTHVRHILGKLGVTSRSKAASLARDAWDVGYEMPGPIPRKPR